MSRRRVAAGVVLLVLVAAALLAGGVLPGGSTGRPAPPPGVLRLAVGTRAALLPTADYAPGGRLNAAALAALVRARIPATAEERRGGAVVTVAYDRSGALSQIARLGARGGTVTVSAAPIKSTISAPAIRQQMRNDCEATALSILLAAVGRPSSQRTLQSQLPRSGPPDPVQTSAGRVWGDPELGFVGRPDGGGTAGGFGVYQGPVRAVASRHGVTLIDLTNSSTARVRQRLLRGHPVLAWVGLSDGPYGSWRSPAGRAITVNFGEHAVVLTGIDAGGAVTVDNPLTGGFETWSAGEFAQRWELLGRRALSA